MGRVLRSGTLALALCGSLPAYAAGGLTGDWGGLRPQLSAAGVDLGGDYIGETVGNLSGGIARGSIYEGRLELTLDLDLGKLAGWDGATIHANAYQIHGHGPSANLVGNINDVSNIEALPATRLFTLWLQQDLPGGRGSLRVGQIAADDEFLISPTASNLINATFGWAGIAAADTTSGGPVYPLATPGVRLALKPASEVTALAAVFSGDPAGSGCHGDPQLCNPSGTTFSFGGGALWIGELQYSPKEVALFSGLPGTYKLGGWLQTGAFADQHYGLDAMSAPVSLALPQATNPLTHRSDFGIYAVADQMLWRAPGSKNRGLNAFLRLGFAPPAQNLISLYADAGLGYKGLVPGRDDDVAVLGIAYSGISPDASALDRDRQASSPGLPIRNHEAVLEFSYVAQATPWLTVQPDLQYVWEPGGNIANPSNPASTIGDALVLALRARVQF